jgi:hypothetical protein
MSELKTGMARLKRILAGESEYGRSALAVVKAEELIWQILKEHPGSIQVPPKRLVWLRGEKIEDLPPL